MRGPWRIMMCQSHTVPGSVIASPRTVGIGSLTQVPVPQGGWIGGEGDRDL